MKEKWIVGTCSSGSEGVSLCIVYGTKDEVKKFLLHLVNEDRWMDKDSWSFGAESTNDIVERYDRLYTYGCYDDYHIDYSAERMMELVPILL